MRNLGIILVLLFNSIAGWTADQLVDKIVAKVDTHAITLSELQEAAIPLIQKIPTDLSDKEQKQRIMEIENTVLLKIIDEYVIARAARDLNIEVTDEELDTRLKTIWENAGLTSRAEFEKELEKESITLDDLKDSLRRQGLVQKVMYREIYSKIKVFEKEIRESYDENSILYTKKAKVRVGLLHIAVETGSGIEWSMAEDTITDVHGKLLEGIPFEDMVKKYSTGPAKDTGGDIGFIEKGKGIPEFEDVAFSLNVGGISSPFKTEFGWNIIKLLDKQEESIQPFSEVRDQIEQYLKSVKASDIEMDWLEKERAKTYIDRLSAEELYNASR